MKQKETLVREKPFTELAEAAAKQMQQKDTIRQVIAETGAMVQDLGESIDRAKKMAKQLPKK